MDENEKKKLNIKKIIIKLVISILIIAGIIVGIYFLFKHFGITNLSKEKLQEFISSTGVWGPLVYILISFLQVNFIPIPATVTIVAGCFLFNPWLCFLYSYIGILSGSLVSFFLGRKLGKPFVYWIVGDKEIVENYLIKLKGRENILLFFMFLFPFFPDDILCAIAGITTMRFSVFTLIQIFTRITTIAGNILFLSGYFIPYDQPWGIALLVILSILGIVAFIISMKFSEQIQSKLIHFIDKFSKKKNK